MTDALHAKAFTLGNSIAFAPGQYSATSPTGRSLLGHELAHVIQQRNMNANTPQAKRVQRQSKPDIEEDAESRRMCLLSPAISREEIVAEVNEWVSETGFFAIIPTSGKTSAPTSAEGDASASWYSDWTGGLGGGAAGTLGQLGGFSALGWKIPGFGLHAKGTQVFIRGTPFIFSLKPPQGSYTPSGGSTSHAFLADPLRPNRGLRVDYHPLSSSAGKSVWHWNHQSVASTFNVTNHSTAGAAAPGRLASGMKAGGRILVPIGIVVSGVEIANSPTPVYEAGRQVSGWAGAAAGGALGAKGGAAIGAAVGVWFGGVGAIPGATIGGFIGGLGGGIVGWFGGTKTYEAAVPVAVYPHD
jgi:hypothetical protein